jgi:hypothetical protein
VGQKGGDPLEGAGEYRRRIVGAPDDGHQDLLDQEAHRLVLLLEVK